MIGQAAPRVLQRSGGSPAPGAAVRRPCPLRLAPWALSRKGPPAEPSRQRRRHVKISACCFRNGPLTPFPPESNCYARVWKEKQARGGGARLTFLQYVPALGRARHWAPWPLSGISGVSLLPSKPLCLLHFVFSAVVGGWQRWQMGQAPSQPRV